MKFSRTQKISNFTYTKNIKFFTHTKNIKLVNKSGRGRQKADDGAFYKHITIATNNYNTLN